MLIHAAVDGGLKLLWTTSHTIMQLEGDIGSKCKGCRIAEPGEKETSSRLKSLGNETVLIGKNRYRPVVPGFRGIYHLRTCGQLYRGQLQV